MQFIRNRARNIRSKYDAFRMPIVCIVLNEYFSSYPIFSKNISENFGIPAHYVNSIFETASPVSEISWMDSAHFSRSAGSKPRRGGAFLFFFVFWQIQTSCDNFLKCNISVMFWHTFWFASACFLWWKKIAVAEFKTPL